MSEPFLTVITRSCKRPTMLRINQHSLEAQTDPDYEQILLVDEIGRGIEWSHTNIASACHLIRGEYVFMLDDDDKVIEPTFIAELKQAAQTCPDLIMIKMQHVPGFILPDDECWEQPPQMGHIGVSGYVVRRDLWVANVGYFAPVYWGDFTFINAVYPQAKSIVWLDRIMTATQNGQNFGKPEPEGFYLSA